MSAYTGLAGQYDAFTGDVPYGEFADLYERIFSTRGKTPRVLLDLACGTGTLALEMSRRGYELIAADASPDMLSEVMDKFSEEPGCVPPVLLCQSMQELDLYGTVDAVYSSLDSFNYLSPGQLPEVLRRLALFTEPGGLVIFDVNTPERFRSLDGQVFVDEREDVLCLWRAEFDTEQNRIVYGMDIFERAGALWRREQEEHIEYAHSLSFLRSCLGEAGFYDIELIADGPQHQFGRVFFVAANSGKGMKNNG
ncbi:MAG: class I SAM-dependent DNA methyltransferase [Candidatus Heteroscillospira sp.]|jgi:SAM-dependent methyltransferase